MQRSKILGCVIGNNSYIGEGCVLEKSLVLGNDYYTNEKTRAASLEKGESALGVGAPPPGQAGQMAVRWRPSEHKESLCCLCPH